LLRKPLLQLPEVQVLDIRFADHFICNCLEVKLRVKKDITEAQEVLSEEGQFT
jgi:hypothetical protein